jgi:long-chain-fatty-acid--CoA ligase ACSBG
MHSDLIDSEDFRVTDPSKTVNIFRDQDENNEFIEPITIPELLSKIAEKYADKKAMMFKEENSDEWKGITYKEYRDRVEKMAKVFIKLGLNRFESVAVFAINRVEWVIAQMAAIHAR